MEGSKKGILIIICGVVVAAGMLTWLWAGVFKAIAGPREDTPQEKEQVITTSFDNIEIQEVSADVILCEAENEQVKVICTDTDTITHKIDVSNGTLKVEAKSRKGSWLRKVFGGFFSLFSGSMSQGKTYVYLPAGTLGNLLVETVSGDVEIGDTTEYTGIEVSTVSGDISVKETKVSGTARFETTSGDTALRSLQASSLIFNSVSGDVQLTDAGISGTVTVETVSGDVSGNILGEHSYEISTVSGNRKAPEGSEGGAKVSVDTTSGDVKLD